MRRMRRIVLLLSILPLAACGRQASAPSAEQAKQPRAVQAEPSRAPLSTEPAGARNKAAGAADTLRRYYGLLEAGRYADAWLLRSNAHETDPAQLAAHFKAYEAYQSQIGTPSEPVASQGWIYV